MSAIYQKDDPTIGDLEKGDYVEFPDGYVYRCLGRIRVKKALGGVALKFVREQRLTARMFHKPLQRLGEPHGRAFYGWSHEDPRQDSS